MKVLVTGSSGMLGVDLCQILSNDHEVVGIDIKERQAARGVGPRCKAIDADITNHEEIEKIVLTEKPDIMVHTAAWTDVDGCELDKSKTEKVNVTGTEVITEAACKIRSPLIYISTDFVFNGKNKTPYKEDDKPDPISVYGMSKYKGEARIKSKLKNYVIVRTSWLFGKNGNNFIKAILKKAENEKIIKVVNDQEGSPTYTKDLSCALKKLIEFGPFNWGNIFHVSNSGTCTWYDYAVEIIKTAGMKGVKVEPIASLELARPAKRPSYSVLDNKKFQEATAYKMPHWKDAFRRYMAE